MSAEEWHGECHAAGMSGKCGIDCPVLSDGECNIEDEILEVTVNENLTNDVFTEMVEIFGLEEVIDCIINSGVAFDHICFDDYIDKFKYEIIKKQTKVNLTDTEILKLCIKY